MVDARLMNLWNHYQSYQLLAVAQTPADEKAFQRRLLPPPPTAPFEAQDVSLPNTASTGTLPAVEDASTSASVSPFTSHDQVEYPAPMLALPHDDKTHWFKLAKHVYALSSWWLVQPVSVRVAYLMRTIQYLKPQAVFCGESVLALYGLRLYNLSMRPLVIVRATSSYASRRRSKTTAWKHYKRLDLQAHPTAGIRHICLERILIDSLTELDFLSAVQLVYDSIARRLTSEARLRSYAQEHPHVPGLHNLFAVLHVLCPQAENAGEACLAAAIQAAGFAKPQVQRAFENPIYPDAPYRVDFCWSLGVRSGREHLCALELDGIWAKRVKQLAERDAAWVLQREVERMGALMSQGCTYIGRATYEVAHHPQQLRRILQHIHVPSARLPKRATYRVLKPYVVYVHTS